MVENDDAAAAALRAGALDYLVKGASRAKIQRALEAVVDGETILGRGVGGALARLIPAGDGLSAFPTLTDRAGVQPGGGGCADSGRRARWCGPWLRSRSSGRLTGGRLRCPAACRWSH
jgi:hypothetical protein